MIQLALTIINCSLYASFMSGIFVNCISFIFRLLFCLAYLSCNLDENSWIPLTSTSLPYPQFIVQLLYKNKSNTAGCLSAPLGSLQVCICKMKKGRSIIFLTERRPFFLSSYTTIQTCCQIQMWRSGDRGIKWIQYKLPDLLSNIRN